MRKPALSFAILATLAPLSIQARPPALAELGTWLKAEQTKRKASAIDLAWIADYMKP